jgi:glycosyltransferase involved in cell wall biosynthesis
MKIAFISIVKDPWGGSEELWARAAEEAMKSGHQVIVSAYDRGEVSPKFKALKDAGAELYLRRGYIRPGTPLYPRVFRKALNFALDRLFNPFAKLFLRQPDIVVYSGSCYSIKDDQSLMRLLKKTSTPLIINTQVNLEYTRPINDTEAALVREAYQYSSQVTFVSERNAHVARRHLVDQIPNATIVRNPVNLTSIEAISFPDLSGKVHFAMVANMLVNHKGHDILFDVLRSEKWMSRSWDLSIYGSGDDERYIRQLCAFYQLEGRIHFKGRTNNIRAVWEDHHLLIMPSLCEGIPLAVVEAMLCARPVVATDTGGHMEWIDDGVEGYIAEGANVYSIDNALERAWGSRHLWSDMGMKAHKRASAQFDPAPGVTFLNLILAHGRRP